jgi:hypothetical protein
MMFVCMDYDNVISDYALCKALEAEKQAASVPVLEIH